MTVFEICVDEVPESCGRCPFMEYIEDFYPCCVAITDKTIRALEGNPYDMHYRRSDCPLSKYVRDDDP